MDEPRHRLLRSRRAFLTRSAFAAGGLLLLACDGDDEAPVTATGTSTTPPAKATESPRSATPIAAASAPPAATPALTGPTGFAYPIAGACMLVGDQLMPNAPRTYRNGIHEGLDFYPGLACAPIQRGTPILAAKDGTVVRADLAYQDITLVLVQELDARTKAQGFSDPVTLDIYRGRQVWVDHGGGVVTRHCHMQFIDPAIRVGVAVKTGTVLGGVGESGTPEFITAPNTELHLHWELRVGESFLGSGLPPATVRALYERVFTR